MADVSIKYLGTTALASLWAKVKSFVSGSYVPSSRKINGYDLSEDRDFITAVQLTLQPEDWSSYSDTFAHEVGFTVNGVDSNDIVMICPVSESSAVWYDIGMRCSKQEENKLYFVTDSSFTEDLTCNVLIIKVAEEST